MFGALVKPRRMSVKTDQPDTHHEFRGIRYGLEGALLGVALVGIVTWASGSHNDSIRPDLIGAVIGFAAVFAIRYFFLLKK
jgi:hypothetical protein